MVELYQQVQRRVHRMKQPGSARVSRIERWAWLLIHGFLWVLLHLVHHPSRSFEVLAKRNEDGTWKESYSQHVERVQRAKRFSFSGVVFVFLVVVTSLVLNLFTGTRFFSRAATQTFQMPQDVGWSDSGVTKSNLTVSGSDLVLTNKDTQVVDTSWASNNYSSADFAINPTTEVKLKAEVAANFTSGSGLNTGSNDIRDVFDNGTYLFIVTAGGLDVITKSTNTSKGYVSLASGFTAVYADATNVYVGDGDGGVFKYVINNISGNTSVGTATYLSSTSPSIVNNNVNDLWGAVISGSTYLAVATSGGVTVVNETAGTSKNSTETSSYSLVRVTTDNELYYYGSTTAKLQRKDNVSGLGAGFTETVNYTTATTPAILSNTINTIEATVNTSTAQAASNTVFVGTASGLSVLQEHSTQASGTAQNYVNEATAGDSGYASTGFKSAMKFDGTNDYVKVSDDDDMDFTSNFTVDMYVKFPGAFSADSQAKDAPLISKGEQFQAYFDHQTGKLNFEFGDQGPLGAGASTASTVGLYAPQTGTVDHVNGMMEFNDVLYIGTGTGSGRWFRSCV